MSRISSAPSIPIVPLLALALAAACGSPPDGTLTTATAGMTAGTTGGETETGESEGTGGDLETETESESAGDGTCEPCGPREACIAGTCVDVDRQAIEAGCHPLSQGVCMYPWPSNFTTYADPESATGLRLDYDPELLPINDLGQRFVADEIINDKEGFSPNSQLRFVTPRGVRSDELAGIDAIADSLAADATILLLGEDGVRWPIFAEVDARVTDEPGRQAVFIRPMRRLDFGSRYLVAVRGLRDPSGAPVEPSPLFRALRDDLATDLPELEALRSDYDGIFATLEAHGIARGELQLAWDFTTIPEEAIKRDAVALVPQVHELAGAGDLGYQIYEVEEPEDGPIGRRIRGAFRVPNCMEGDAGPGSLLRRDDAGLPRCEGTVLAPFIAGIPRSVLDAGIPAPVAVYGHGLLGNASETVAVASKTGEMILVGTDWWGMADEDIPNVAAVITGSFANGRSLPERLLQSAVNFSSLAYLLTGDLAGDPAMMAGDVSLVDTAVVHYIGGSQGGIMGGTTVALAPNLDRGVLVVGGANYSLMVWRSTAFGAVDSLWSDFHADDAEREFLFALYQSTFDLSEPVIYAEELRERPFAGNKTKELLLIEAIGDTQVPNIATEMMARSYGMEMAGPAVYEVFGVPSTTEPITGGMALLQVDTQKPPLPPQENLPADSDNGAHGASADGPGVQATIAAFLLGGLLQSQCDGPCDPD